MSMIGSLRLMIVEDNVDVLEAYRLYFKSKVRELFTARTGEEAILTFRREKPGMIFVDLMLPDMSGLDVVRHVKALSPETRVVVVTGHAEESLQEIAGDLQVERYVRKPVLGSELEAIAHELMPPPQR